MNAGYLSRLPIGPTIQGYGIEQVFYFEFYAITSQASRGLQPDSVAGEQFPV
jgi:hypothetical protein